MSHPRELDGCIDPSAKLASISTLPLTTLDKPPRSMLPSFSIATKEQKKASLMSAVCCIAKRPRKRYVMKYVPSCRWPVVQ